MIRFKNHKNSGLTLFEVMAAITIIGLVVSAVVTLQNSSLKKLTRFSGVLQRVWLGHKKLLDIHQDQAQKKEIPASFTLVEPPTTITYKKSSFAKNSSLASLPNIVKEELILKWDDQSGKQQLPMLTITYQPPATDEKKNG